MKVVVDSFITPIYVSGDGSTSGFRRLVVVILV